MDISTIKKYEVKSYEANANNEMKPYALLHDLEDAAYCNAEKHGWGYSKTHAMNTGWFLIKYHLKFYKLPKSLDVISIKTWAAKSKGVQCRREFQIFDADNNLIGVASTLWILVELDSKKILNPYKELDFPELAENYVVDTTFSKISSLNNINIEKTIEISFDDIDLNKHVNNSNYLKFALNVLPYDFLLNNSICEIEINYKKEAKFGDILISQVEFLDNNMQTIHCIKNKNTNEELATMKIYWREYKIY